MGRERTVSAKAVVKLLDQRFVKIRQEEADLGNIICKRCHVERHCTVQNVIPSCAADCTFDMNPLFCDTARFFPTWLRVS